MNACADPSSCLAERRKHMSYQPGDPRNWTSSPCLNCRTGRDRQMASFVAEPDTNPDDPAKCKTPFRIEPSPCVVCGVIVQKPSYRTRPVCKACYFEEKRAKAAAEREKHKCEKCGEMRTKYATLCVKCYKRSRAAVAICIQAGCKRKPRRKGLCDRHYYQQMAPEERKRKNEANREASRKYREVQRKIIQMKMAEPKKTIPKYREVPE